MKKLNCILVAILAIFMASFIVSCDEDDVSEFAVSVAEHPWMDSEGRIYEFYKYFSGVIYENETDYGMRKISKSFIWSETDSELTIGINGYRNDKGEMEQVFGNDIEMGTYKIESSTNGRIELKSPAGTLVLVNYHVEK